MRAVEADYIDGESLTGRSGLAHPVIAIGYDQVRRRLVVVSNEPDARAAATAQADIQAILPEDHVSVVRPVGVDFSRVAQKFIKHFGVGEISSTDISNEETAEEINGIIQDQPSMITGGFEIAMMVGATATSQIIQAVKQLAEIDLYVQAGKVDSFGLRNLANYDALELDRQFGTCGIPLYSLNHDALEGALERNDADWLRDTLRNSGILSYFFPPPDSLALSLVDRGVLSAASIIDRISQAPVIGHPLAPNEYTDETVHLPDLIESLKSQGYIVEGEVDIELTDSGQQIRYRLKFAPREGLVSKIIQRTRFGFDLSPTDLIILGSKVG